MISSRGKTVGMSMKRQSFYAFILMAWALFVPIHPAFAGKGQIVGKVRDGFGRPVPAVNISVENFDFSATTNASGEFSVGYVPGKIKVLVSKEGYTSSEVVLDLSAETQVPLKPITLWKIPPQQGIWFVGKGEYVPLLPAKLVIDSKELPSRGLGPAYQYIYWGQGVHTVLQQANELIFLDNHPGDQSLVRLTPEGAVLKVVKDSGRIKDSENLIQDQATAITNGLWIRKITLTAGMYAFVTLDEKFKALGILYQGHIIVEPVYLIDIQNPTESAPR